MDSHCCPGKTVLAKLPRSSYLVDTCLDKDCCLEALCTKPAGFFFALTEGKDPCSNEKATVAYTIFVNGPHRRLNEVKVWKCGLTLYIDKCAPDFKDICEVVEFYRKHPVPTAPGTVFLQTPLMLYKERRMYDFCQHYDDGVRQWIRLTEDHPCTFATFLPRKAEACCGVARILLVSIPNYGAVPIYIKESTSGLFVAFKANARQKDNPCDPTFPSVTELVKYYRDHPIKLCMCDRHRESYLLYPAGFWIY